MRLNTTPSLRVTTMCGLNPPTLIQSSTYWHRM